MCVCVCVCGYVCVCDPLQEIWPQLEISLLKFNTYIKREKNEDFKHVLHKYVS